MGHFTILSGLLLLAGAAGAAAPPGEVPQKNGPPAVVELLEDDTEGLVRTPAGGIGPITGRDFRDFYSGVCSLRVGSPRALLVRPPGWNYPIVETPGPGQYRYLRFAWKRVGGNAIMLRLYTAGGPAGRRRYLSYVAGVRRAGKGGRIQTISVADTAPAEWTVVTRDLFQDVGPLTITGIALLPLSGGEAALFDHIYLGRTVEDLDRASAAAFGKKPLATPLKRPRLEDLWRDLASRDVAVAGRALRTLVAGRRDSVPFLAAQLAERPPATADDQRILKLIAELDDNRFRVRETASRELAKIGGPAVPFLRAAVARNASLEVRRRCEQLLDRRRVEEAGLTVDQIRLVRAIRVLEWSHTAAARQALERAASGVLASAGLADDARRALERSRP